MDRWRQSKTSVHNIGYHLIWCPKYRRKVLVGPIEERLGQLLKEKAEQIGISVEYLAIMPEHVHLFVKARPVDSPQQIIHALKGYTSRILRQEFSSLRTRLPSLWTRSYYVESVGHISESVVKKYIEEQKNK